MNADTADGRPEVFAVRDCAMVALATGRRAQNLKELRTELQAVDTSSIYFHFWGVLLQPGFEEREYNNDFAEWVRHQLHDPVLAERLGVIDPSDYADLEQLRAELCDTVEARLDERETIAWSLPDQQFEFRRSQIVVFRTPDCIAEPADLPGALGHMSTSSLFYHFIDARRRVPDGSDDFRAWLGQWGDEHRALIDALAGVDPYFTTLVDLRQRLAALCATQLS
ncbi:MAG: hypothetical protein CMK33_06175 [Porticoccaceae bacterium]|nr:hypothetical protein [Porticoccaceae bacterium]